MKIETLNKLIRKYDCQVRFLYTNGRLSGWSKYIISPAKGYIEGPGGPVRFAEVRHIEIDALVKIKIGRLIPEKEVNYAEQIIDELGKNGISSTVRNSLIIVDTSFLIEPNRSC